MISQKLVLKTIVSDKVLSLCTERQPPSEQLLFAWVLLGKIAVFPFCFLKDNKVFSNWFFKISNLFYMTFIKCVYSLTFYTFTEI